MPWARKTALLVAFGFPVQYRALRCAHDSGLNDLVLGSAEAACLRYSRFCSGFAQFEGSASELLAQNPDEMLRQVEHWASKWGASLILPADKDAVALLGKAQGALTTPVFPVPKPADFELLDDKWSFHQLCRKLSIGVPRSWIFENKDDLLASVRRDDLPSELIVKPTRLYGEIGVMRFRAHNALEDLAAINYSPIMVQEYIEGVDVNCSIVVVDGQACAKLSYVDLPLEKRFNCEPTILYQSEMIAGYLGVNGIFNFDTRRASDGEHYFLECNPRPFMSMHMSAQAGVNCFAVGIERLNGIALPTVEMAQWTVRKWRGLLRAAATPWTLTRMDLKVMRDAVSDPLPRAYEFSLALSRRLSSSRPPSRRSRFILAVVDRVLSSINGAARWLRGGASPERIKM